MVCTFCGAYAVDFIDIIIIIYLFYYPVVYVAVSRE